jgi:hypothetical protein
MVVLSLRNRQNRECVDEDLRANKKVFERTQQQIAIMPQSDMPPNDKLQAIAYQFNKDVENVKNALNDGLTNMNSEDAIRTGFADFSKVSLAWNKLVARINPYLKGKQQDPNFEAATAGDYNYVRQKLQDDLLQFFTNGLQQINSWKEQVFASVGIPPTIQNEPSIKDITQQLTIGFYKNVRYGAEQRGALYIPRLPIERPAEQPPQPPQQPQDPQQQGLVPPPQQIPQDIIDIIEEYEQAQGNIAPDADQETIIRDILAQQAQQAAPAAPDPRQQRILGDELAQYIPQYLAERRDPQQPEREEQSPSTKGLTRAQIAIANKINELGLRGVLSGYSSKSRDEQILLRPYVKQVADALGSTDYKGILRIEGFLNRMVGIGRGGQRGRPLRLANDFTGTQVVPNTLADLKNRYKGNSYIGTMTGDINPKLQNSSVLGSARRRMEGAALQDVLEAVSRMSRAALENILFPAFNALGQAIAQGVQVGRQIPPAVRRILETTRGVYRREDVQTILQYLKNHPDVLIPFLPTPYAVGAVVGRLVQSYMNLPPSQTGTEAREGREPRFDVEVDDFVLGEGSGRCCFNSAMCNGTKAYRFKRGEKSANVRKTSVRGAGFFDNPYANYVKEQISDDHMEKENQKYWKEKRKELDKERDDERQRNLRAMFDKALRGGSKMEGGGNGVNVNVKYAKLPKALQPTEEDLNPTPIRRSTSGGVRRPRMPRESYEGFQDQENDVYTQRGGSNYEASPLVHSEMLQDKALGLLKGLPRRLGVEDPKFKPKK